MVTTPAQMPLSSSLPLLSAGIEIEGVAASPHETLLFRPELDLQFDIVDVVHAIIPSPIPNSTASTFTEMRVKIAAEDREDLIPA